MNVPRPGARLDEAARLELAVSLRDGVRIDREVGDDLTHRGQLVADVEQPEPKRLLHLLDDLEVRRHAGPRIEMELDHRPVPRRKLIVHEQQYKLDGHFSRQIAVTIRSANDLPWRR